MASKPDLSKKYKNGTRKKSWRKGKKIAIYMDGKFHHFGDSKMSDYRKHGSAKRKKAYYSRHAKNTKGNSPRAKAFRVYNRITWDDGGIVQNAMLDDYLISNGYTILPDGSIQDTSGTTLGLVEQEALRTEAMSRMKDSDMSTDPIASSPAATSISSTLPASSLPQMSTPTASPMRPNAMGYALKGASGVKDALNSLRGPVGLVGAGIQAASNIDESDINIGGSALGGALQGIAGGGLLGGVIGGATGFASAVSNKVDYEESERDKNKAYIQNNTVQPFSNSYETGGEVQESLNLSPAQTEKGESMLLPDGTFTKVASKEKHSKMEDDEITDLLPSGTLIFSEKLKFDPSDIGEEENLLGYGTDVYEDGQTPSKINKVLFTNLVGGKKLSFSDAAKMIDRKYPINTDNDKDVLTMKTNNNNRINRAELLGKLFEIQEAQKGVPPIEGTEEYGNGGMASPKPNEVPVPYYGGGGNTGDKLADKVPVPYYNNGGDTEDELADEARLYLANDDIFNKLYDQTLSSIDRMGVEGRDEFDTGRKEYSDLNNRLVASNVLNTGVNVLGNLAQSPIEDPELVDSSFANMEFKQTPNSVIDSQIQQLRAGSNSLAAGLLNSGTDPRLIPSLLAPSRDSELQAESSLRSRQLLDQTNQDRARGAAFQVDRDFNNRGRVRAGNDQRTNRNQIKNNLANIISSGIVANSSLDSSNVANQRANRSQFINAMNTLEEARRQANARNANFSAMDQYLRESLLAKTSPNDTSNTGTPTAPYASGLGDPTLINGSIINDIRKNSNRPLTPGQQPNEWLDRNKLTTEDLTKNPNSGGLQYNPNGNTEPGLEYKPLPNFKYVGQDTLDFLDRLFDYNL